MGDKLISMSHIERLGATKVVADICKLHGLYRPSDIFGTSRQPQVCRARDHVVAVLRWTLMLSSKELGAIFWRDHSTILGSEERHEKRITEQFSNPKKSVELRLVGR